MADAEETTLVIQIDDDYVCPLCNYHVRPDDPHEACEACRAAKNAGKLCTLTVRCKQCSHLSAAQFRQLLKRREQNKKKLAAKHELKRSRTASAPSSPIASKQPRRSSPRATTPKSLKAMKSPAKSASKKRSKSSVEENTPPDNDDDASVTFSPDVATYHTLEAANIHMEQYCAAHQLHDGTIAAARSSEAAKNIALAQLSEICSAAVPSSSSSGLTTVKLTLQKPVGPDQQESSSSNKQTVTLPKPDKMKEIVDTAVKKARRFHDIYSDDSGEEDSTLSDSGDEQTAKQDVVIDSSSESACSDPPAKTTKVPIAFMRDLRCPTPAPMDQSFDGASIDTAVPPEPPMLRQMYEYIGKSVEGVQAVALPSPSDSMIRSSLQPLSASTSRLALTTSPCTKACITKRQSELQNSLRVNKPKEYLRVTASDALRVKSASYSPGDNFWGITAPPIPAGFQSWLPTVDRNHKVPFMYNDVCSMETTARLGLKAAGDLESALVALASYMTPYKDDAMAQQLYQFFGSATRDVIKSFSSVSTSLYQARRDLVLSASSFDDAEQETLRFSQYHDNEFLLAPDLLNQTVEKARQRVQDEALRRSVQ